MARYQPEHKQQTRERLVTSAVSTLRRDGIESAGLKEIMQELGLTVGGFYRHFPSKSALVEAAVAQGLVQSLGRMRKVAEPDGLEWIEQFATIYLSQSHRRSLADGCVLAALSSDIARGDESVKAACEQGLQQFHAEVRKRLPLEANEVAERLWGLVALEVGGLLLSRMVASDKTAHEILESCRLSVTQLVRPKPRRRAAGKLRRGRRGAARSKQAANP